MNLSSNPAQLNFAEGNNESPAVPSAKASNAALESLGKFKTENLSVATIGKNQVVAQKILDRVGYK